MTGPSEHGRAPIERWLADGHRDLRDGLSQFLDSDAGLRETMLYAEHASLLGALDSRLDTEAGLAVILTPPPAATSQPAPGPGQSGSFRPDAVAAITAADPAVRMDLRRDPAVLALIFSDLLIRALALADASDIVSARTQDPSFPSDLNRASRLFFARRFVSEHGVVLGQALWDVPARVRAWDGALGAAIRARARGQADDSASALDRARGYCLDNAVVLARVRDVAGARARSTAVARVFARDFADGPFAADRVLAYARARDDLLTRVVGLALGVRHAEGLAAALLDGALDDFTRTDLTRTDLTGLDLRGVRWSVSGTRWPPGTNIEALQKRSRKIAHDIYQFTGRRPGGDDNTRHHAPDPTQPLGPRPSGSPL